MLKKENMLNNDWRLMKFEDCILQLNTGLNPRSNFSLGKGNLKYITAKNLTKYGTVDFSKSDSIDEDAKRTINKRSDIQVGDILFSSRAPIGHCYLIKEEPNYYDIGESIFSIRVDKKVVIPEYLCLYLTSNFFVKLASKHTTGSIIQEIRIGDLMGTKVIVPPLKIQKDIADCLYRIDRKIALNDMLNDNLLQQLMSLVYENMMSLAYSNQIEGSFTTADKLTEVITGREDANFSSSNGKYKFFTCSNTPLKCDEYAFESSSILIAGNGDFNVKHYSGKFNAYQRTYVLTPAEEYYGLLYLSSLYRINSFKTSSAGSIVKFITKGDIENIPIFIPKDKKYLSYFNELVLTQEHILSENDELTNLRDWLLPMLMNGQATIEN